MYHDTWYLILFCIKIRIMIHVSLTLPNTEAIPRLIHKLCGTFDSIEAWSVEPKFLTNRLSNKKAHLSRDVKVCQKLLQFDVLTTLSLTILAYHHSFSCCCVRNLRNSAKFTKNSNLWSSRSSKVIDLGVNGKPICDLLLVINSNFGRICYRFRDIHG